MVKGKWGANMCGRFVGFNSLEMLQAYFPIDVADVEVTPNYNVAPTQEILAISRHEDKNHLLKYHWGLVPFWAKKEQGVRSSFFTDRNKLSRMKTRSHYITMIQKIDSAKGRNIYSRRIAIVEPVFGNIRTQKRLDTFNRRSKIKVNIQWLLYCIVHNIEKVANYGFA